MGMYHSSSGKRGFDPYYRPMQQRQYPKIKKEQMKLILKKEEELRNEESYQNHCTRILKKFEDKMTCKNEIDNRMNLNLLGSDHVEHRATIIDYLRKLATRTEDLQWMAIVSVLGDNGTMPYIKRQLSDGGKELYMAMNQEENDINSHTAIDDEEYKEEKDPGTGNNINVDNNNNINPIVFPPKINYQTPTYLRSEYLNDLHNARFEYKDDPEMNSITVYQRQDKSREGSLKVGYDAPDAPLLQIVRDDFVVDTSISELIAKADEANVPLVLFAGSVS